jgi:FtsZ-binding cell division protein ZapB
MEEKIFNELEARVKKAVVHIDELTNKNDALSEENRSLAAQVGELEKALREAEKNLARLENKNSLMSTRIKEKVEGLVSRIDGYEKNLQ